VAAATPEREFRPADYLVVAAWFALTFGLAEAGVLLYRSLILNEFIWSSRDVLWMAPLAYLIAYGFPAATLALADRWWPRLVPPLPVVVGVLTCVATALLLRLAANHRIHDLALLVLGAGVAVQVGRGFASRPSWLTGMRWSIPRLAAAILVASAGWRGYRLYAESRAQARLPTPPAGAPNVLLLLLDTVRGDNVSLYGYGRPTTPRLDAWARRGIVFERAVAPSTWTLQSHASFFTGRYPHELGVDFFTPLDDTYSTLAGWLQSMGYRTGGFVANRVYAGYESGLARGFIRYSGYRATLKQILLSAELGQYLSDWNSQLVLRTRDAKLVTVVNDEFLDWLDDLPAQRPFFAFLNYMEAHVPYTAPDSLRRVFGADTSDRAIDAYDAAIAHMDQEIGGLLDTLAARGTLARTIVIVTSDHGELFGEHGIWEHANNLYYRGLRVPLVLLLPDGPAGLRVEAPVSLRRIPATIERLLATGGTPVFPGPSLVASWDRDVARAETPQPFIVAELAQRPRAPARFHNARGPALSLLRGRYHYIRAGSGREELYDYWADPAEQVDLVGTPDGQTQLRAFRLLAASIGAFRKR
jgi:arylsulfatase A-like enzyme